MKAGSKFGVAIKTLLLTIGETVISTQGFSTITTAFGRGLVEEERLDVVLEIDLMPVDPAVTTNTTL